MTEPRASGTWRLFWAVVLPPSVQAEIADLQEELARQVPPNSVRWIVPDHVHLTLVFLGNWRAEQVPTLAASVREAVQEHGPFTMNLEALGVFPNPRRPRVVWVGVGGEVPALKRTQAAVARAMVAQGWEAEKRPYSPHLTIGRVRKGLDSVTLSRLGEVVGRVKVEPFGRHQVHEVVLFKSDLRPSGAVYTPVARVSLTGE